MLDQEMAGHASLNCQYNVPKLLGLDVRWYFIAIYMPNACTSPLK
jgi:hypothetical protein